MALYGHKLLSSIQCILEKKSGRRVYQAIKLRQFLALVLTLLITMGQSTALLLADPPEDQPPIDVRSEVTSREQIGHIRDNVLILCPTESKVVDLSAILSRQGRFNARARVQNRSTASVSVQRNRRNHVILTITAGANDTNQDKLTRVQVQTRHEILGTGVPEAAGRGTQDRGHGIHGSGENSRPHQVQGASYEVRNGYITVRVLAKRKCDEIAAEEARQAALRAGQNARQAGRQQPTGRNVRICRASAKRYNLDSDVSTLGRYNYRNNPLRGQTPRIEGVEILSNSNPTVAYANMYAIFNDHRNRQGMTADPVMLVIHAEEVGQTTIRVKEFPLPVNVLPWEETYNVTVIACDNDDRRREYVRSFLPRGYQLMPIPPSAAARRRAEENSFREFMGEDPLPEVPDVDPQDPNRGAGEGTEAQPDEDGGEKSATGTDSDKSGTDKAEKDNKQSSIGNGAKHFVQDGSLAALVINDGGKQVKVACPNDTEAGDTIACSVLDENDQVTDAYKVQVTSTAVFEDDETEELPKVAIGDNAQSGRFSWEVPLNMASALISLTNSQGQPVGEGHLPIYPHGTFEQPTVYGFPAHTELGQPIRVSGPMTETATNTAIGDTGNLVQINNQPANVIAQSPRGVIAQNTNTAVGQNDIAINANGANVAGQSVPNMPPTDTLSGGGGRIGDNGIPINNTPTPTPGNPCANGSITGGGPNLCRPPVENPVATVPGTDGDWTPFTDSAVLSTNQDNWERTELVPHDAEDGNHVVIISKRESDDLTSELENEYMKMSRLNGDIRDAIAACNYDLYEQLMRALMAQRANVLEVLNRERNRENEMRENYNRINEDKKEYNAIGFKVRPSRNDARNLEFDRAIQRQLDQVPPQMQQVINWENFVKELDQLIQELTAAQWKHCVDDRFSEDSSGCAAPPAETTSVSTPRVVTETATAISRTAQRDGMPQEEYPKTHIPSEDDESWIPKEDAEQPLADPQGEDAFEEESWTDEDGEDGWTESDDSENAIHDNAMPANNNLANMGQPVANAVMSAACLATVGSYQQSVRSMLDSGWQPPKPPSKGDWLTKLKYQITSSGQVQNVTTVKSSGYNPIDQSARQRVQSVSGELPALPGCFNQSVMDIDHDFHVLYK